MQCSEGDRYPIIAAPPLSMSELICKTYEDNVASALLDAWFKRHHKQFSDWFEKLRGGHEIPHRQRGQLLAWNTGELAPENIFCRTVDTARVIPLDRTWTTHIYYHKIWRDREQHLLKLLLSMMPELMLLRGMHEIGCEDVWMIFADLTKSELDEVTEYFKLVCSANGGRTCKPSLERKIRRERARVEQMLRVNDRLPCLTQMDITFRGILNEKKPRFIIINSHHHKSYAQVFFTHEMYVPSEEIFNSFPSGCPDPDCGDDCELVRFPRKGMESAIVLPSQGDQYRFEVCNWAECGVCFSVDGVAIEDETKNAVPRKRCSKCKLVSYCSVEHQRFDWAEHKRVCIKYE